MELQQTMRMEPETKKTYRLGLALSGGGSKGFAHLGAIQALDEWGIRPDVISGTSAGGRSWLHFMLLAIHLWRRLICS